MGENIVGLFNIEDEAQAALRDLRAAGFSEAQVSIIAKHPEAAEEAVERREAQSEMETDADSAVAVPQEQRAHAAQPGGTYIIVRAHSNEEVQRALELMDRYNVANIEHREQAYHEGNWEPLDENVSSVGSNQMQSRSV